MLNVPFLIQRDAAAHDVARWEIIIWIGDFLNFLYDIGPKSQQCWILDIVLCLYPCL